VSRIDELQKKYPTIHRDTLIKFEIWDQGVRYTRDMDKAGQWSPARGSYMTKFDNQTLQEMVAENPHRLKDGKFVRPDFFTLPSTVGGSLYTKTTSPYTIREIAEGKFAFFEGEEKVVDVYFDSYPWPLKAPPVTSRGTPWTRFLRSCGNCFALQPQQYCEYFPLGKQCKFCNFNPSQEDARAVGMTRPLVENVDDVVEALLILSSEVKLLEGRTDIGGFMDSEAETKAHARWMEKAFSAMSHKPNMTVHAEAATRKQLQRLKDAGVDCYVFHIEVGDPLLFAEICPGKAEHASYEGWIESIATGLEVFGEGNVSVRTINGLTLMPENGHKTWQEARDSHIEFLRAMIKMGVLPAFSPLALPPGSVYGGDPSLLRKLPPTDYHFDLMLAQHEAMTECGLYDKINKLMWCGLDITRVSCYTVEIEVMNRYGNWGNWMADTVPEEMNWLLKQVGVPGPSGMDRSDACQAGPV